MPLKPALETRLTELLRGRAGDAAEPLVRGYGPEILTFLGSMLRDDNDADEAFAMWSEDVWRGISGFRGECSFRTWGYQLARHAAHRLARGEARRREKLGGDDQSAAEKLAWEIRTSTAPFRRTAAKDAVRALRDELPAEERELIVLRVDRGLDWKEIAVVVGVDAAVLRKRFERTKDRLRVKAQRAGLIPES